MSTKLFDHEWQFLLQMSTRLHYCGGYHETCNTFLQQIRTLIPFHTGVIFQAGRENGHVTLNNPVSTEPGNDSTGHSFFLSGQYPRWDEFIMSPYSCVFRQSDIIPAAKWEKTRVYRDLWQPKGLFWGLFITLVHKDVPLAVLGLQRDKDDNDFTERDIHIMNMLKDPLERKFFHLQEEQKQTTSIGADKMLKTAASFGLTRRETEIVSLVCTGKGSDEMCEILYITHATLSKHLSNIYAKTNLKNRTQLFALFQ